MEARGASDAEDVIRSAAQYSIQGRPPKHCFFLDLPEYPLREEWTALKNGVHGREKIMGIHFVHVPVMGPRFILIRTQMPHSHESTNPFHPHLNVEGAHHDEKVFSRTYAFNIEMGVKGVLELSVHVFTCIIGTWPLKQQSGVHQKLNSHFFLPSMDP